ncbi:MAG: 16S rRNA (uracil(1498)-N(3))-methyltransferase [Xanthomonadaceae bacterium]|nr:16S rRNA (uracil(1498)-N(3))-methyltransferase [Xanthomonadaceae bacterium]
MSDPHLYVDLPLQPGTELELPTEVINHLRVLRLGPGQRLRLFNGQGGEYLATLLALERRSARVAVERHLPHEAESPLAITLIQGVSKGERMDFTIQKAVELGVTGIQPVFTERSVVQLDGDRLEKRSRHWRGVAIAACEQCGRNRIPELLPPLPLAAAWDCVQAELRLVLNPLEGRRLRELPAAASLALLVGPEGGLSEAEVAAAIAHGFVSLQLGPRILRTETAGLAALAALQALHGDL